MEPKDKIIMNTKATKIGGSLWILIPSQTRDWIEVEDGTEVKIQTEKGKHGNYLAIWNPQQK